MRLVNDSIVQEFADVVLVNYTLQEMVLYELITSPKHKNVIQYHTKLNQRGRKQWLQDIYRNDGKVTTNSVMQLEQLAQDVDCLYYYLSQMNPSILQHLNG